MRRTSIALLALFALLVPLAACGGDDDGGGGGDSLQAYCDFSASLDGQEDFPTDDQLDELADLAPDEIADDVEFAVDRFKDGNDNPEQAAEIFDDPEVVEHLESIESFEEEKCGREPESEDE